MLNYRRYDSPPLSPGSRGDTERCAIAQLSWQMSNHSLRPQKYGDGLMSETCSYDLPYGYASDSSNPPTELDSPNSTFSLSPTSTRDSSVSLLTSSNSSSSQLSSGYLATNVRQQRQQALRRQCSASHLREISELVSRMVSEGHQCSVSAVNTTLSRKNSDPSTNCSSVARMYDCNADNEGIDGVDESLSEPEPFNESYEGFKVQEGAGCVSWNCPWTSRARSSESKCCVKKDTSSRKRGRRRAL